LDGILVTNLLPRVLLVRGALCIKVMLEVFPMKKLFALLMTAALLLGLAACGGKEHEFPMQGTNLADLHSGEIIHRITEFIGAEDSIIYAPVSSFGFQVNKDFVLQEGAAINIVFPKKNRYYGCQLQIRPSETLFWLAGTWKATLPEQYCLLEDYLDALRYLPQEEIRGLTQIQADRYSINNAADDMPDDGKPCIYYGKNGIVQQGVWKVRFLIWPLVRSNQNDGYEGNGDNALHLFYVG